jgi:hypothetical protein
VAAIPPYEREIVLVAEIPRLGLRVASLVYTPRRLPDTYVVRFVAVQCARNILLALVTH